MQSLPVRSRFLFPAAALLWGLQIAFLNPVLALLLVALYGATPVEVGWVIAIHNASGFLCSLAVPAYADRRADYLRPLLVCGLLTVALAVALGLTSSLPVAAVALVVLGGPAGVGSTLLYAHQKHAGARSAEVVRARAIVSVAWVGGPPLATVIVGQFGDRAILVALAVVALGATGVTAAMVRREHQVARTPQRHDAPGLPVSRPRIAVIVAAFVALQAGNAAAVSVMSLYVTESLDLAVLWAGITLGVAAGLEIPALMIIARMSDRRSPLGLIVSGGVAGIAYYTGLVFVSGPVLLIALQVLNAWLFAAIAGTGLTLFQDIIPRPGLASGLYLNTRRVGAILSGPLIGLGGLTVLDYRAVFVACATLTAVAIVLVLAVNRNQRRHRGGTHGPL